MAVTIAEKLESRRVTDGPNPSAELRYVVQGIDGDETMARAYAYAASPTAYDLYGDTLTLLPRIEATADEPLSNDLIEVTVRYGVWPQEYESTFSFETGGGSQHITQSLETIGSYAAEGTAPDFAGAIGVTRDSVEGVDINAPIYQFSETHYLPDGIVTGGYKATLFGLTGKVNNGVWRGFEAGEVLFCGVSGTRRGYAPWELTFRFATSPNKTGIAVGTIEGIAKKGWEYMWVRYQETEDEVADAVVKQPLAVYVERVYDAGDFTDLGIGV